MKCTIAVMSMLALAAATPSQYRSLHKRVAAPISSAATQLIESLEGFNPNFYTINGDKTIGFGHDCTQKGDCASIHAPITKAQGTTLLDKDLTGFESCVCALPNAANLNANQYGALVSFTYNSGCGGVRKYFASSMSSSNFAGICSALPTTNTLNGELTKRRQKEGAFCSQATTAKSGCDGSKQPPPPKSSKTASPSHGPTPTPASRRIIQL